MFLSKYTKLRKENEKCMKEKVICKHEFSFVHFSLFFISFPRFVKLFQSIIEIYHMFHLHFDQGCNFTKFLGVSEVAFVRIFV